MSTDTDEAVATAVQHGDVDAMGEIITRYEQKLRRYARRFLRRSEDIDDVVQEVFIKCYTGIKSYDSSYRFSPWIYRIAHNTFVNELRRQERFSGTFFDADTILPYIAGTETSDGVAIEREMGEEVETLLAELPPKYREIIILHHFEEMGYQEISDVLHIPVNTVGVRLTRARQKLKELYSAKPHQP